MTNNQKRRVLNYRRVMWLNKTTQTLQQYVDSTHQSLSSTQQRTFTYNDGEVQGMNIEKNGTFTLVHLAYYLPNQPTSLVPKPSQTANTETIEKKPPNNHDYMEGDIFLLIKHDDVILCPSGTRDGSAKSYLHSMLSQCGIEKVFSLEPVADIDKVEIIKREGVKKIRMGSSLYKATTDRMQRKTKKTVLLGGIAEDIASIFMKTQYENIDELKKFENLQVRLEISFDKRKKGGALAAKQLTKAGADLLDNEDDDFTIETMNGKKLTSDDLRVSKNTFINAHGKSVSCQDAWSNMMSYYEELYNSGILDE
ncbi:MAG: hypothetical protein ABFR47_02490 [Verrucomicrobiota bacterium]